MGQKIEIEEPIEQVIRGVPVIKHWRLFFDGLYLCSTTSEQTVTKWRKLEKLVNSIPDEAI